MPLRIGFDMDGVLADFGLAFHEVESRLFPPGPAMAAGQPEREEEAEAAAGLTGGESPATQVAAVEEADDGPTPREMRRRREMIWKTIKSTPDFWLTLKPVEDGAVRRIHEMMLRHRWEVFFITQRPATAGDTVQRQTQHWLLREGFDLPSVLVLGGSRGAAAAALRLNYHVDDSAQNCIDVSADSRALPIMIVPDDDPATITSARKLGIGTARSIGESLDILEKATLAQTQPGILARLATLVGWK
jgi:hypothetical protein